MNQNVIGRIAGMLSTAISQDLHRHEQMMSAARRGGMAQRKDMSRRANNRPGCAAEKFAAVVKANDKYREKVFEAQQQWLMDTGDVLF